MSELSETLGHLLCEITRARMAADRESVRIARQYAEDDGGLLRHFPVPRMRMPQLELTLPVVVVRLAISMAPLWLLVRPAPVLIIRLMLPVPALIDVPAAMRISAAPALRCLPWWQWM